jgi:hypothetical protein
MAAGPCRNCGLKVRNKARACPHCGHPTRAPRPAASQGALALPPLPDTASLAGPTHAPLALGATGKPGRASLEEKLGEQQTAGVRGSCLGSVALFASLLLAIGALYLLLQGQFLAAGGWFIACIVLLGFGAGLFDFGLFSHVLTAMGFTALGVTSALAFYRDPSVLPAVGFVVSALMVDYVWAVRKQLRTGKTASFDRLLRPFQEAAPLRGAAPQNALIELNNQIAAAGSIRVVIPEDVLAIEAMHRIRIPADLPGETRILYARYLRHFLEDDFLDDGEKEEIAALEGLLRLPPDVRASVRKAVAAWLYETRASEAMHDGRVDDDERTLLDRIVADLELPTIEAEKIFRDQARKRLKAAARAARADGHLADAELAEVADMAAHLGVPVDAGIEGISRENLERFGAGRTPRIPTVPAVAVPAIPAASSAPATATATGGAFAPHAGEVLHFQAPVELRAQGTPSTSALAGVVSVTSHRLLFVGPGLREEIPLGEIEGIRPRADGVEIQQAGRPGRSYTFSHDPGEANLFVQTLSRAMRAASAGERP